MFSEVMNNWSICCIEENMSNSSNRNSFKSDTIL